MATPVTPAPPPPQLTQPGWRDPLTLLLGAALAAIALWVLPDVVRTIADPWRLNDDMRVMVAVYSTDLPAPPPVAEPYFRRFWSAPPGYLFLARVIRVVADPVAVGKWGTLLLFALALAPLALVGRQVAGSAGALAAAALTLHADVYLDRAAGSMARGFALPLLAWMLYAIATRRVRLFLWLQPAGVLFYPPATIVGGGAALGWMLWAWRTRELRALWRRGALHAGLALAVCLGASVGLMGTYAAQPPLTYAEALTIPPLGPGGRGFVPFKPLWQTLQWTAALGVKRSVWAPVPVPVTIALVAFAAGLVATARRLPPRVAGACACLLGGSALGYGVARAVALRLYVPDRMFFYSMPLVVTVLWIACWVALARRVRDTPRAGALGALLAVASAVALGGPGVAGRQAFHVDARALQPLVAAVHALPPDSVLSGPYALLDTLFATAHRHQYISDEGTAPIQRGAWEWMQPRLWRHVHAYYAADWEDVRPLREDGVTHMLVWLGDYDPRWPPRDEITYEPFVSEIHRLHRLHAPRGFVFAHAPAESVVFQWNDHVLVDLSRVPDRGPAGGGA